MTTSPCQLTKGQPSMGQLCKSSCTPAGISETELVQLQKPAQYLGGERGSIMKDEASVSVRMCLAFPDTYEVGMSHVGMQILYDLLNKIPDIWAERVYQPLPDMEALLRKKNLPLYSLESKRPLGDFDVIGFSLQYELCMNGILSILDLAGIPLLARERDESHPLIIGGGPVVYHPEPFADFFDAFLVGDGEEMAPEFLQRYAALQRTEGLSKRAKLEALSAIQGVYVPAFFEPQYAVDGSFAGFTPLLDGYTSVRRQVLATLENAPFPKQPVVPNIKAVHDRLSVEVMRGCVRGCRFCQAGYLYRPQRERSPEEIISIVKESLGNTGYEELSLLSLSTADYCSILPLLNQIKENFAAQDEVAISFPSTRVDALTPELLQEVQTVRRTGFTVAPEAGTQRMRDVINKGVTEEELLEMCSNVFRLGWSSIKLYFMIGLPTETMEDIDGIIDLGQKVKKLAGHSRTVTVSVSTHVPKPHTPFQWAAQIDERETRYKQTYIRDRLRRMGVNFRYHSAASSFIEGVFARGDRKLGQVILRAYELGCRMDGWIEEIKPELWLQAFNELGIDPVQYLRERKDEEPLPWDHISCDIPKRYFLKEWQRARSVRTTPDCLKQSCSSCGSCDYDATRNVLFDRERSENRLNIIDPPWQSILDRRANGGNIDLLEGLAPSLAESAPSARKERPGKYTLKEYLKTESDDASASTGQPEPAARQRLRVQYSKQGNSRFISHLEIASLFFRAARRAHLPVAFSQGFNPRPRFSFGPPLQLGLESICEFVDIYFQESVVPETCVHAFNRELPDGLRCINAFDVDLRAKSIQAAIDTQTFEAKLQDGSIPPVLDSTRAAWQTVTVERQRKKSSSTISLESCINQLAFDEQRITFALRSASSVPTLKPFEVLQAVSTAVPEQFSVTKTAVSFFETTAAQSSQEEASV